jgi:threonine synthase
MDYTSTRGSQTISASKAILQGIADDGGLFVPVSFPSLDVNGLIGKPYQDIAFEVLRRYLDEFDEADIKHCIDCAYDGKFTVPEITPIKKVGDGYILELFHGRTLAFKDIALSILPSLMALSAQKQGRKNKTLILAATSGDTGKAALEAFMDVEDTVVIVLYPIDGVSDVQKLQMTTQRGHNTHVIGINGNFDDAQNAVKRIFNDAEIKSELAAMGVKLSSANSINIGRLLPQITYYFTSYASLVASGAIKSGDKISFTVPTGNFGDILAGYYAYRMELPVGKLICASNINNILTDFFETGVYDANRKFHLTSSPSMDILISSNLERLLYHLSDDVTVNEMMDGLRNASVFDFSKHISKANDIFASGFATENEVYAKIDEYHKKYNYVIDPHTAVGVAVAEKSSINTVNVSFATASPHKFSETVIAATGKPDILSADVPHQIAELANLPIRHKTICDNDNITETVLQICRGI